MERALEHYRTVNSVLYFAYVYSETFTSAQVLELLHFSEGYRRTWGVQQSTASALVLWDLLHKLVRFAAAMMPTSELMDSKAGACAADAVSSDPAALAAAAATAAAGGAAATAAGAEAGMDAPGNASTAAAQIAVGTGARGAAGSMSPSISTSYSSPSNAGPPISRSAMKSLAALLAPGKGTAARLLVRKLCNSCAWLHFSELLTHT